MKAVILAGGFGTRLAEETHLKPKPMLEIGGKPILWHILKIYSFYGINEFIICCGYKGYIIKEYFANYFLHMSDVTFHMDENRMEVHRQQAEPWKVTLVDTGDDTMTGGRLKRIQSHIGDQTFCFTYGDGVADVNIRALVQLHQKKGRWATLTAVQPPGRYGAIRLSVDDAVIAFQEKPQGDNAWINGGFFVLEPQVFEFISGDQTSWEREPLQIIASKGQLLAYKHRGFWQPMDTLRDKNYLESLWKENCAPWKVWV
ncbi:glucose-1-phosphate cytidylyltransferase [Coleofasciculus chthonoplastes]|uniref:glucose-1-phosphate cytidylyltransferase n=1 Tax=Coleofasciculus chthonoplastes TaxID=64178 RepID=UPI0032FB341A